MLMEFQWHYTDQKALLLEFHLFSEKEFDCLNRYNTFLAEAVKNQNTNFFCDSNELMNNVMWEKIRTESGILLNELGMTGLDIAFERKVKIEQDNKGNELTIESTKTKIIKGKFE